VRCIYSSFVTLQSNCASSGGEKDLDQTREARVQTLLLGHRRNRPSDGRHLPVLYVLCAVHTNFTRGVVPLRCYPTGFYHTRSMKLGSDGESARPKTQDIKHQDLSPSAGQCPETVISSVARTTTTTYSDRPASSAHPVNGHAEIRCHRTNQGYAHTLRLPCGRRRLFLERLLEQDWKVRGRFRTASIHERSSLPEGVW
jgi:hypothetical protein